MTPRQFKQVLKITTRPGSPLKQWQVYAIVILAFFILPLVTLVYTGIIGVAIELILASLLIRRYLQPYFVEDYRVIREGLQRWAGVGILLPFILASLYYGIFKLDELHRLINEGSAEGEMMTTGMLQASLLVTAFAFTLLLVWVVVGGYYKLRKMLVEKSVKGIKKEELFQ